MLIQKEIVSHDGCCALGAVGLHRKVANIEKVDAEDDDHHDQLACMLDVASCLVQEIEYINDECGESWGPRGWIQEKPEARWIRMRAWVEKRICPAAGAPA